MTEHVLIAGCGDVGLRVAPHLLARGDVVHGLRRTPPEHGDDGIRWWRGDLTEPSTLRDLPQNITQLVYMPTPRARDAGAYRAVFVDGLRHALDALASRALTRVLLVSSSAVYGAQASGWVDENTPPAPPGDNGRVLLQAEHWLAEQAVRSIVLRLGGLYGPGRCALIERLRAGQVKVPRQTPHWANRIHVDDAAAAIAHLLALEQPQSLYVGVDDTPLPLDALYDHIARLLGAPSPADGAAPAGIGSKRLSNARLRASGFVPQWPDTRAGYAALLDAGALAAAISKLRANLP